MPLLPTTLPTRRLPLVLAGAAVTVTAVTAGGWFGVLGPARAEASARGAATGELEEAEHAAAAAEARAASLDERREVLRARLAAGVEPGRLDRRNARLAGLLSLAERAGLEVLRLHPTEPTPGGGFARVSIDLEAVGVYATHLAFLGGLDAGPEDLSVEAFRLTARGDGKLAGVYGIAWIVDPDPDPEPAPAPAPEPAAPAPAPAPAPGGDTP